MGLQKPRTLLRGPRLHCGDDGGLLRAPIEMPEHPGGFAPHFSTTLIHAGRKEPKRATALQDQTDFVSRTEVKMIRLL